MERTSGRPEVKIGVIDGPVLTEHPDLDPEHLTHMSDAHGATCTRAGSAACLHGTFVTGILAARRSSRAPAICPDCTVVIRPIFAESHSGREYIPSATPQELAAAMFECVDAGVRVINLSLSVADRSAAGEHRLREALDHALRRGVIVVAAAGNESTLGSSAITSHSWVIPVVGCDVQGRPLPESNIGRSIGRSGVTAPGDAITSLGPDGGAVTLGGTSVAAPFVTGTVALLSSEFPAATAAQIRLAVTHGSTFRRASIVPPLLDAAAAYDALSIQM